MVRIRKNASRLLGSDYLLYPPLPPLPAHSWDPHSSSTAAAEEEEGRGGREGDVILCRLNCSPWDVIGTHLHHSSCCFQEEEGEVEGRGIMGNGLKFEEYEEILSTFESLTSCSAPATDEIELKSKDDIVPKKVKKMRRKRNENVVCSKNDGKGWNCKRPANPQHTLCDHHLGLLRNYSSKTNGNGHRESYNDSETERSKSVTETESAGDGGFVKGTRRPKVAALETAGDDFYYYSGFGPLRGKKRSGTTSNYRGEEADDDDEGKMEERKNDSGDESNGGPVAGDDLDDDDDDEDEVDGRIVKKRGRKRVKARSLKSLT